VYYMAQLLAYGIAYGLDQASGKKPSLDPQLLQSEAKVRFFFFEFSKPFSLLAQHLIHELQLVQASKPDESETTS